jgi:hypothetical protein
MLRWTGELTGPPCGRFGEGETLVGEIRGVGLRLALYRRVGSGGLPEAREGGGVGPTQTSQASGAFPAGVTKREGAACIE